MGIIIEKCKPNLQNQYFCQCCKILNTKITKDPTPKLKSKSENSNELKTKGIDIIYESDFVNGQNCLFHVKNLPSTLVLIFSIF